MGSRTRYHLADARQGRKHSRKMDALRLSSTDVISRSSAADDAADGGAVNAEQPGDVGSGAARVQHGEHFGLLLGRELELSPAMTTSQFSIWTRQFRESRFGNRFLGERRLLLSSCLTRARLSHSTFVYGKTKPIGFDPSSPGEMKA